MTIFDLASDRPGTISIPNVVKNTAHSDDLNRLKFINNTPKKRINNSDSARFFK
jgi:hypothetical protein